MVSTWVFYIWWNALQRKKMMHHVLGIAAGAADTGGAGAGTGAGAAAGAAAIGAVTGGGAGAGAAAIGIMAGNGADIDAPPSILISSTGSSLASTTGLPLCIGPGCMAGFRFPTAGGTGTWTASAFGAAGALAPSCGANPTSGFAGSTTGFSLGVDLFFVGSKNRSGTPRAANVPLPT